jgi:hypothetical protein
MRVILVLLLFAAGCKESFESNYPTYDAAIADGAVKRGWLPDWLPKSATDIHEWHNIDTNATIASFAYGQAEPSVFLAGCHPETQTRRNHGRASWWPNDQAWRGIKVYRCDERIVYGDGHAEIHPAWAGVDEQRRRAYFWR